MFSRSIVDEDATAWARDVANRETRCKENPEAVAGEWLSDEWHVIQGSLVEFSKRDDARVFEFHAADFDWGFRPHELPVLELYMGRLCIELNESGWFATFSLKYGSVNKNAVRYTVRVFKSFEDQTANVEPETPSARLDAFAVTAASRRGRLELHDFLKLRREGRAKTSAANLSAY